MHSPPKRAGWKAGTIAVVALGGLVRLAGCHNDGTAADMGPTTNGDMAGVTPGVAPTGATSVTTVDRPLAAVLSPDAQMVYFTAHDGNGYAQLYSVPAAGGTPTKITTTTALSHPLSMAISPDGQSLYIADSAGGAAAVNDDSGTVFKSSLSGSISSSFDGFRYPSGVAVSADGATLFITGFDKTDGKPGVFAVSSGGGTATALAKGTPFVNPSALYSADDGAVYVVDATALGTNQAGVIKVRDGSASLFNKTTLQVGYAAGIAPVGPGSTDFLITGNNGVGNGVVYKLTAAGDATALTLGSGFFDPATIARAANGNSWIVVDTVNAAQATPGQQQGTLYRLAPPS